MSHCSVARITALSLAVLALPACVSAPRVQAGAETIASLARTAPGRFSAASRGPRHSTILSARSRSSGGTVSPIALAVFRLMTSSIVVGCSTGRSEGFAPLRILST